MLDCKQKETGETEALGASLSQVATELPPQKIKLKAYVVSEPNEGECVVVFATQNVVARREGANQLGCEFEGVQSCTREPEFDQYAPGPVPLHATLAAGWWHTCSGCQCEFEQTGLRHSEEPTPEWFAPIEDSQRHPYCCQACMMRDWQEGRLRKARESAAIEYALARWPQAIKVWVHCRNNHSRDFAPDGCHLLLPQLKDQVTWQFGEGTVGVSQRDVEMFQRLYGIDAQQGGAA